MYTCACTLYTCRVLDVVPCAHTVLLFPALYILLTLLAVVAFAIGTTELLYAIIGAVVTTTITIVAIIVAITICVACARKRSKLRQISKSIVPLIVHLIIVDMVLIILHCFF